MLELYTLEKIKSIYLIDRAEVNTETKETTIYGSFTIRAGSVAIFANRIKFHELSTAVFAYAYNTEGIVAMYQYDVRTKELIL